MKSAVIVGIDEAGRGPLAGPVSVGVLAVKSKTVLKNFIGVKDSKQLSEKQRGEWLRQIRQLNKGTTKQLESDWQIRYAVSMVGAKTIDQKGISYAVRAAIRRSLYRLERDGFINLKSRILLDGLLHAPKRFRSQKTIIGGDSSEPIIALASICAKVHRDRRMKKLAKLYPKHGFEIHKGYGTKAHYKAIKKYRMTEEHRRSYLKNIPDK